VKPVKNIGLNLSPSGICANLRTVAASNNRVHMPWSLYYCLFAPHICMVLFFTHIPFVVNHTINATSPERLQQLQFLSFSNSNINSIPTYLPKNQILSPNYQFSQRIWYVECCSVHAHMAWSQKIHKSEISLDTGDSASNAVAKRSVLSVFINQRCAECVCLYYGLRVCGQRYIIIRCDRLRKSCTAVE